MVDTHWCRSSNCTLDSYGSNEIDARFIYLVSLLYKKPNHLWGTLTFIRSLANSHHTYINVARIQFIRWPLVCWPITKRFFFLSKNQMYSIVNTDTPNYNRMFRCLKETFFVSLFPLGLLLCSIYCLMITIKCLKMKNFDSPKSTYTHTHSYEI